MKGEYITHNDPGDECDFEDRQEARMSREGIRQMYIPGLVDPIMGEQVTESLRILDEGWEPEDVLEEHRRLLEYWGVFEKRVDPSA